MLYLKYKIVHNSISKINKKIYDGFISNKFYSIIIHSHLIGNQSVSLSVSESVSIELG